MKCFVISLKTEVKRHAHIEQAFLAQGIPFTFFDAVTPKTNAAIATHLGIETHDLPLSQAEIACLLSHLAVLRKIVDEQIPYAAIFEDDVHLGQGASRFLCDDSWIPASVGLIKLERFKHIAKGYFKSVFKLDPQFELFKLKGRHLGAAGYIVSLSMAKRLLNDILQYDRVGAIDKIIFEDFIIDKKIDVYQLQPAICAQDSILYKDNVTLNSSLNRGRILPKKHKLSVFKKVKREYYRFTSRRIHFIASRD